MRKAQQTQKKIKIDIENKYYVWVLFAVFLITLTILCTYKIIDDDIFWHLATGKFIIENKYVPDKDVFGFATQNTEWIPFEWGWDVVSYGIHSIGGLRGLEIFRSIIYLIIFSLYFFLLRRFKVNTVISILLLFLLSIGLSDRLSPRPHIVTYLFLVLVLYLFLTYKYIERERYFKRLYFLPLIFLVWGNFHLGVIAGLFLLVIFTLSEIIIFYFPSKCASKEILPLSKEHLTRLIIILFVSALVLSINPHGLQTYVYAYNHTKMKMLESIAEWYSPFTSEDIGSYLITIYKILLFSGILVLVYAYRKRDLTFGLVYLAFLIYSIRAIRFTIDYEIIILFFLAVSSDYFLRSYSKIYKNITGIPGKVMLAAFLIFVSYFALNDKLYYFLRTSKETGLGLSNIYTPVSLYNFMKQNNISGNPLNNFDTGGYHLWQLPNQKIFIDSRNLNDEIFNEYMSILYMKPGFEKKLEQYGIDYVIFFEPKLDMNPNLLKQNITEYLSKSKE